MATWSGALLVGQIGLDHINWLGSVGEIKVVVLQFFSLILDK